MSQKIYVVELSAEERAELKQLVSKGKAAAHKRRHAQILLKADAGPLGAAWTDGKIAEALEVSPNTVRNVRQRLVEGGLEAALNRKKQQRRKAPVIDGRAEAHLVAISCGPPPKGRVRWTLHLLADRLVELQIVDSVSHETVRQTLKKTSSNRG